MAKSKKIIIDTNLWISHLISGSLKSLDDLIISGKVSLVFSEELFTEFIEVVSRPKFRKYFSEKDIDNLQDLFDDYGEIIKVTTSVDLCRDPKDNFLLNLCIDSKADYLITGDNDLLVIKEIESCTILAYSEFVIKIN